MNPALSLNQCGKFVWRDHIGCHQIDRSLDTVERPFHRSSMNTESKNATFADLPTSCRSFESLAQLDRHPARHPRVRRRAL